MKMLHFADAVGMQLLFDLNQFYRAPDGSWDASNARLLLRDACAWGFTSVAWQLGNGWLLSPSLLCLSVRVISFLLLCVCYCVCVFSLFRVR